MALSTDEHALLDRLHKQYLAADTQDERLLRYYQGQQRVEHLGMALPPSLRRFLVVTNWPRVVVDTIRDRQQVRWMILPGEETADPQLRDIWDASNLSAHVAMFNQDRMVYGRAFMSVGSNEDNPELPLVRVESPREMTALVDVRRERVDAAARFYGRDETSGLTPTHATLYLPEQTIWCEWDKGVWRDVDRDRHRIGRVPVVMHLNRRMSGGWVGDSEMTDVIPLSDAAARSLSLMQFAQESHGIPRIFMTGVSQGDFVDPTTGKPIPRFEAYFNALHTITSPDAKMGQLTAADLKNFETSMSIYGKQASTVTGFPGRYFGINTTNPPGEGAIRADEATLIRSVETQNEQVGMTLGWVGALALRFATQDWVPGNRVRVDWFDPATPTVAQRMDAVTKAKATGILSREGSWDELGWSEARKAKERGYFEAEATDPVIDRVLREFDSGDAADGA